MHQSAPKQKLEAHHIEMTEEEKDLSTLPSHRITVRQQDEEAVKKGKHALRMYWTKYF